MRRFTGNATFSVRLLAMPTSTPPAGRLAFSLPLLVTFCLPLCAHEATFPFRCHAYSPLRAALSCRGASAVTFAAAFVLFCSLLTLYATVAVTLALCVAPAGFAFSRGSRVAFNVRRVPCGCHIRRTRACGLAATPFARSAALLTWFLFAGLCGAGISTGFWWFFSGRFAWPSCKARETPTLLAFCAGHLLRLFRGALLPAFLRGLPDVLPAMAARTRLHATLLPRAARAALSLGCLLQADF